MPRDIFGCHNWGKGGVLLASSGQESGVLLNLLNAQVSPSPFQRSRTAPPFPKSYLVQNVNSAEIEEHTLYGYTLITFLRYVN